MRSLKAIELTKNKEFTKSYHQIHYHKQSFEKTIDEVIAHKDIINGEFESIIDRKYVEFEQQNNTINNLKIIIDKKKRELAQIK